MCECSAASRRYLVSCAGLRRFGLGSHGGVLFPHRDQHLRSLEGLTGFLKIAPSRPLSLLRLMM